MPKGEGFFGLAFRKLVEKNNVRCTGPKQEQKALKPGRGHLHLVPIYKIATQKYREQWCSLLEKS